MKIQKYLPIVLANSNQIKNTNTDKSNTNADIIQIQNSKYDENEQKYIVRKSTIQILNVKQDLIKVLASFASKICTGHDLNTFNFLKIITK